MMSGSISRCTYILYTGANVSRIYSLTHDVHKYMNPFREHYDVCKGSNRDAPYVVLLQLKLLAEYEILNLAIKTLEFFLQNTVFREQHIRKQYLTLYDLTQYH